MPKPDLSTWLTKAEAAEAIGVSTKTIEKLADQKQLQHDYWQRPETGARVSVYHPGDVARIRKERNPDAQPFVLPPGGVEVGGAHPLAIRQPPADQFMRALAGVLAGSENSKNQVRLEKRLYLTIPEACDYTGLGLAELRRRIAAGKLKVSKGAGPRGADVVRRLDLEKL